MLAWYLSNGRRSPAFLPPRFAFVPRNSSLTADDRHLCPDLRIVVVEVRSKHRQHAMVAVRTEGQWLLLDNRTSILIESSKVLDYYDPLYALDQDGVRQIALSVHPLQMARSDQSAYQEYRKL